MSFTICIQTPWQLLMMLRHGHHIVVAMNTTFSNKEKKVQYCAYSVTLELYDTLIFHSWYVPLQSKTFKFWIFRITYHIINVLVVSQFVVVSIVHPYGVWWLAKSNHVAYINTSKFQSYTLVVGVKRRSSISIVQIGFQMHSLWIVLMGRRTLWSKYWWTPSLLIIFIMLVPPFLWFIV